MHRGSLSRDRISGHGERAGGIIRESGRLNVDREAYAGAAERMFDLQEVDPQGTGLNEASYNEPDQPELSPGSSTALRGASFDPGKAIPKAPASARPAATLPQTRVLK